MCIFCAIKVCDSIRRKFVNNKQIIWGIGMLCILFIGISSQIKVYPNLDNSQAKETVNELQNLIAQIENNVPEGTAIYQLPNQAYPTGAIVNNMMPNAEFMPYIYSTSLRWSYGALSNEESYAINTRLSEQPINEVKEMLLTYGYGGILIDTSAYTEDEINNLINLMSQEYGSIDVKSTSGRWLYYEIK